MAQLDVTQLDFDQIKAALKTYLSSQSEFTDYDFEGSALSIILDALAVNTHYNAILAHMVANESFIDTAIKRSSVVSIAKSLGYTPRSTRSASATVNLVIEPSSVYLSSNTAFTLGRDTAFTAKIEGTSYTFYPTEAITQTVETNGGVDQFVFNNLLLKEGKRLTNKFVVQAGKELEPFVIPNKNVDTTTLRVRVQSTTYDTTINTYNLQTGLLDTNSTSKIYFLEENSEGTYQIRFGDDVIGAKLSAGNLVTVDYLNSSGTDGNAAKTFTCSTTLTDSNETLRITTVNTSSGGQNKESIDSIRLNAPRNYSTQQRAVTAQDYKNLILASNSNIQSVAVWGGEQNDPPMYGKIFISLDPVAGQTITQLDKDNIVQDVITPKGSISMIPVFVDPDYTYVGIKAGVVFNPNLTTLSPGQIKAATLTAINDFFNTDLNVLNKNLYYSKLHNIIKNSSDSIVSVNIGLSLQKRLLVNNFNIDANYSFTFNSRVHPRELHSTWFNVKVNGTTIKVKMIDVPESNVVAPEYNGLGRIQLVDSDGKVVSNVGTIDYSTGRVTIERMNVSSLYGTEDSIRVTIRPHDDVKDISTSILTRTAPISTAAVFATPAKNTILTLDDTSKNFATGSRTGLDITVTVDRQGY